MAILNLSGKEILAGGYVIPAGTMIQGELSADFRSEFLAVNDADIDHIMQVKDFLKMGIFFVSESTRMGMLQNTHEKIELAKKRIKENGRNEHLTPAQIKGLMAEIKKQESRAKTIYKMIEKELKEVSPKQLEILDEIVGGLDLDSHNFIIDKIARRGYEIIKETGKQCVSPKLIQLRDKYC